MWLYCMELHRSGLPAHQQSSVGFNRLPTSLQHRADGGGDRSLGLRPHVGGIEGKARKEAAPNPLDASLFVLVAS